MLALIRNLGYNDNMMEIGSIVKLKVRSPLWANRSAYAYPLREFETYEGTVLPSPRWVGPDQLCLSTGDPKFPFRVIERANILGEAIEAIPESVQSVWTIKGSKGQPYIVTRNGSLWSCNCVGFGYRRSCTHVNEAKSLIYNEVSKSLILKEEKKSKKSKKSACLIKRVGVESKYGDSAVGSPKIERGNSALYIMKRSNMSKRSQAIEVMKANADKEMSVVVKLIATEIKVSESNAKSYYRYIVANGLASGTVVKSKREAKAKVTKSIGDKIAKAVEKSSEDIAAIKAKNLATLKKVSGRKEYKNVARVRENEEFVSALEMEARKAKIQSFANFETNDLPSFENPEKLTREQVKHLV